MSYHVPLGEFPGLWNPCVGHPPAKPGTSWLDVKDHLRTILCSIWVHTVGLWQEEFSMGMEKAGFAQVGQVHLGSFAVVPQTPHLCHAVRAEQRVLCR